MLDSFSFLLTFTIGEKELLLSFFDFKSAKK